MIRFHFISKQDMKYIVKPKIARVFNREVLIEILNDLIKGVTNQTEPHPKPYPECQHFETCSFNPMDELFQEIEEEYEY